MPSSKPSAYTSGEKSTLTNVPLATVAAKAGVSEATVSRVLNRRYGVSAKTREVVESALSDLGYERKASGEFVLILVPSLRDIFFAELCDRFFVEFGMLGIRSVVGVVFGDHVHEHDYVESLIHSGVAAVVFLSVNNTIRNSDPAAHRLLQKRGIPFVTFNGRYNGAQVPVFSTDDWRAAELAVDHLYALGHRRLGLVTGPEGNVPAERRLEGFLRAIGKHGLDPTTSAWTRQPYGIEGGRHGSELLLHRGMTGIVAASDEMALGAIRAVRRRGLRVPEDISIVGYNDSALLDYTDPALTSVTQPSERIAKSIAAVVMDMISNRPFGDSEILLEPELRVRATTAPPA